MSEYKFVSEQFLEEFNKKSLMKAVSYIKKKLLQLKDKIRNLKGSKDKHKDDKMRSLRKQKDCSNG